MLRKYSLKTTLLSQCPNHMVLSWASVSSVSQQHWAHLFFSTLLPWAPWHFTILIIAEAKKGDGLSGGEEGEKRHGSEFWATLTYLLIPWTVHLEISKTKFFHLPWESRKMTSLLLIILLSNFDNSHHSLKNTSMSPLIAPFPSLPLTNHLPRTVISY